MATRKKSIEVKPDVETFAKILVLGIGGSGGSAINRMIQADIRGVKYIAINTDAQALNYNKASKKINIGREATRGLGAGMDPELGARSAEENEKDIREAIKEADMVFITCGLGGGTGTGAAPIIADIAKEEGSLTVAVVTRPFSFEGPQRNLIADKGMEKLIDKVDTLITIPNDKLLEIIDKKTTLLEAFSIVDEVLKQGVQGISELITVPGLVNVDFADVKSIMTGAGSALMGIGRASGENRAQVAAKQAIESPLLEMSINGARGVLFTVTGGQDLSMFEINEAAEIITSNLDENAKVIFGAVIDESLGDDIKITVIATGFGHDVLKERDELPTVSKTFEKPYIKESSISTPKESKRNIFQKLSTPTEPKKEKAPEEVKTKEEEELEIPAFIRRKMGDK